MMTTGSDDRPHPGAPIRVGATFEREFPWAERSATEATVNLIRTADLLVDRVAAVTRPYGISAPASNVLGILDGAGEPLPPHVISERLFTHRATLTGLLDSLERRGLVRRTPHPTDRRMLLIEITDAGRAAAAAMLPETLRGEMEWLGALTHEEQEALVDLLGRVQARLYEIEGRERGA